MKLPDKPAITLGALGLLTGAVIMVALQTNAQTGTTSPPTGTTTQQNQSTGTHVGSNGVREEILTGDTAERARTAALNAVPGGTIVRLETDAEGAVYEAHMTRPDGTPVTVKFDSNFQVTGTTQEGFGRK